MCGIFGTVNFENLQPNKIIESISHRGPDADGHYKFKNINFLHSRLSILDLSEKANQPMHSPEGDLSIIFNGEIYNHLDLRGEIDDYKFKTTSDTETILAAYKRWGSSFINKLNGIFAFALLDKSSGELMLARDHFGVKPLYIYQQNGKLAFGSEIKAFKSLDFENDLDIEAIVNYNTFMWSPGNQTCFKSIKKFPPGHFKIYDIHQPDIEEKESACFYKVDFSEKPTENNESYWIEKVDEFLTRAVSRQLLSDVPVGFFLSGGLDSSLLVAIARKLIPEKKINCYTIDTGESKDGFARDLDYAEIVAKELNATLNVIKAKPDLSNLDRVVWHMDEPQADYAPYNVLNICECAKKIGSKVLISGTGGDDIFTGYRRHKALYADKFINVLPSFMRNSIKTWIDRVSGNTPRKRRMKKLFANIHKAPDERIIGYFIWLDQADKLLSKEFRDSLGKYDPTIHFKTLIDELPSGLDKLNKFLFLEIYTFLVEHNLNYTDKMSMACGVEVRVPFLDVDFVNLSTEIPTSLKMKNGETKYILKKVAERYLPKEVIYRPKTGFGAPIEKWFKEDLYQATQNKFRSLHEVYDTDRCLSMLKDHKSGRENYGYPLLSILSVNSWLNQFK